MLESSVLLPQPKYKQYLEKNRDVSMDKSHPIVESARLQNFFHCNFGILQSGGNVRLYHLLPYLRKDCFGSNLYENIVQNMITEDNSWLVTFGKVRNEVTDFGKFLSIQHPDAIPYYGNRWSHITVDSNLEQFSMRTAFHTDFLVTRLTFYEDNFALTECGFRDFIISQKTGEVIENY